MSHAIGFPGRSSGLKLILACGLFWGLILATVTVRAETVAPKTESMKAPAIALELETLEFVAPTNLKALTVKGKAKELNGQVWFEAGKLSRVEATVRVDALETGMSMRDHHMKERVFSTADGKTPDLVFTSQSVLCPDSGPCEVKGGLQIRGVSRDAVFLCQTTNITADCTTKVRLSAYGIPQPTQLGITVQDEVSVALKVRKK